MEDNALVILQNSKDEEWKSNLENYVALRNATREAAAAIAVRQQTAYNDLDGLAADLETGSATIMEIVTSKN